MKCAIGTQWKTRGLDTEIRPHCLDFLLWLSCLLGLYLPYFFGLYLDFSGESNVSRSTSNDSKHTKNMGWYGHSSWGTSIFKKLLPWCYEWTVTQSCCNMMINFSTCTDVDSLPQTGEPPRKRTILTVDLMRNKRDFDGSCGSILRHPYISQVAALHTFASCAEQLNANGLGMWLVGGMHMSAGDETPMDWLNILQEHMVDSSIGGIPKAGWFIVKKNMENHGKSIYQWMTGGTPRNLYLLEANDHLFLVGDSANKCPALACFALASCFASA